MRFWLFVCKSIVLSIFIILVFEALFLLNLFAEVLIYPQLSLRVDPLMVVLVVPTTGS